MVEKICQRIAYLIGTSTALVLSVTLQVVWVLYGSISHKDPFPFVFMLTVSNMIQLTLIFILANGQRTMQDNDHKLHRKIDRLHEKHDELHKHLKK